jgi:tagaturonate reductase
VLPSILEYQARHGKLPEKLTFSLAALIAVYKDGKVDGTGMQARREKGEFVMKDDVPVLEFFAQVWSGFDGSEAAANQVAGQVLANTKIWGQDLNQVAGLTDKVGNYLYSIAAEGMQATVRKLIY